ncbi:MAG: thiolase family protein [Alphaproteobacteria bacterium]|nr:thiolase family protein [Alphaproteobacteria bacterium]MBU1281227.1 thiolase family protein [Alphaproteobacteria bacterium]MBU1575566.1 thiolase family protein [Alphaproteobacteria bacterium]MBU2076661.1 thiolase family protein [Alphaproteobacteria bacterium]MBU2159751.1 thiolase family protein [Alphaproteobacteria bacterium]
MAQQQPYDGVVVCAPVTVPYTRYSDKTAHWWAGSALKELSRQTGLGPADFDGFCFSSFSAAPDTVVGMVQHLGLSPRWMDHIPTGGASGVMALRRAARGVQAGDVDIVACVAADTNQIDSFRQTLAGFSRFSQDASYPYGFGGPNATFALITDAFMRDYGVTRDDFAKLCIAQRSNALSNPHALMKKPLTHDAYMAARPIADPVHLFDCVMPCAGAEAFVVTTPEKAQELGLSTARLSATIERHNAFAEDPVQTRGGWARDIDALWSAAGCTPQDVDMVQLYDDYPVIVAMQLADLGLCDKAGLSQFIAAHDFTITGSMPLNTNGGQLSAGQAGAAGGFQNVTEGLRQVLHCPLGDQVPDAKRALISGFGLVNYDRGVCTGAAILEQDVLR